RPVFSVSLSPLIALSFLLSHAPPPPAIYTLSLHALFRSNSGFAPEAASLSPGLVLLSHLIRDAIARGRARFDFLRGEERYKLELDRKSTRLNSSHQINSYAVL